MTTRRENLPETSFHTNRNSVVLEVTASKGSLATGIFSPMHSMKRSSRFFTLKYTFNIFLVYMLQSKY